MPSPVGSDGPDGPRRSPTSARRRAMAQFVAASLAALAVLIVGATLASRRAGTGESVRDVGNRTEILARSVVEPVLPAGLVDGDRAAIDQVDRLVRERVIDSDLIRVKIWDRDGTIVYSDEERLIGSKYPLGAEDVEALDEGLSTAEAEVSDLSKPENRYERGNGKMLEVYLPVQSPEGEPLLFETYFRYDSVTSTAARIRESFLPIVIGALLLLTVLQLPLAWGLSSRLVRGQAERERLLRAAVDASDLERRRIAADLHDGVVQDLTGVTFQLAGVAEGLSAAGEQDRADAVAEAAGHTRTSIQALRSLLVEIYPPNLHEAGIENALSGLLASLATRGMATSLEVQPDLDLGRDREALVFRAAQEGIRNVARHSRASSVSVRLVTEGGTIVLEVRDDGVGLGPGGPVAEEGHVGLTVLSGLVDDAGGSLSVGSAEGSGTVLRLEVPA